MKTMVLVRVVSVETSFKIFLILKTRQKLHVIEIKSVKTNNVPNITQIQSASFSIFLIFKPNV